MRQVGRFFGWSVVFSLFPYAGVTVTQIITLRQLPEFDELLGSGQLLITSVALLAGGLKELSGTAHTLRLRSRDFALAASAILAFLSAWAYGTVANLSVSGGRLSPEQQSTVTVLSLVVFVLSVGIAAVAVGVSAPERNKDV